MKKEYKALEKNNIFESVDYDKLMYMIDNFGTGLFLIGGPWCKYCQAIAPILDEIGKDAGLDVIYNYDPKFVDVFGEDNDLRDCKSLEIKLKYYAIVEKIGFKSPELVKDTLIPRIHTPFIFGLRNGSCVGYYSVEVLKKHNRLVDENKKDRTIDIIHNVDEIISKIDINSNLL